MASVCSFAGAGLYKDIGQRYRGSSFTWVLVIVGDNGLGRMRLLL